MAMSSMAATAPIGEGGRSRDNGDTARCVGDCVRRDGDSGEGEGTTVAGMVLLMANVFGGETTEFSQGT